MTLIDHLYLPLTDAPVQILEPTAPECPRCFNEMEFSHYAGQREVYCCEACGTSVAE